MFKRNIHILKDAEEKTEATNSSRPHPDEVNLGSPLPDALPGRDYTDTDVLLKRIFGPDYDVLIVDLQDVGKSEPTAEQKLPEPDWPYKATTDICFEVFHEVKRATQKHASMNSPHEGYAVILEELDELWAHVKADTGRSPEARKEAIQVAAMAVRYILDLRPS